jgi:homoprotocatechuate degradation regulator HpaR
MTTPEPKDAEFRGVEESLTIVMLRAREALMAHFRPILAARGLTEQQWRVIRVLATADALTATDLAERAALLTPSLSRIIKALEARGLIASARPSEDARRVMLRLTAAGRKMFDSVAGPSEAAYREIEQRCGEDELKDLLTLLHHVINRAR